MDDTEIRLVLSLRCQQRYLTREEIAVTLNLSLAEIDRTLVDLKARGYRIDEVPGQGLRLVAGPISLDGCDLRSALRSPLIGSDILTFRRATSTNDVAVNLARGGAVEGTVVVAEEQTKGRGRIGRNWYSPPNSGLWFSVILRPSLAASRSTTISLAGALAITRALKDSYGVRPLIKWPNDILVDGRKICGILTEGEFTGDRINFVVLGVGLNVLGRRGDFPVELQDLATTLEMVSDRQITRTEVLSAVLHEIERQYLLLSESGFESLRREILSHSMLVGSVVKVVTGNGVLEGVAADIDEKGALMVRKENGTLERVIAGDVVRIA